MSTPAPPAPPSEPRLPRGERHAYVDAFRGLLIAHMALDHASLMFNRGRPGEELAALAPAAPANIWQFLTRFTGVQVAPGFFLMAGFMVALTSMSRELRGVSPSEITRRLVIRGLVLLAVDTVIMGIPRMLGGFYSFMVLSSIGVAIILLALARNLPNKVLLPAALAVLALHPLLNLSGLPVPLQAVLHETVRTGHFRSLYPIIPWAAIVFLGYVVGRDAAEHKRPERRWLALSALSLGLFFVIRLAGGYGNAHPPGNIGSYAFWSFAKYPPDLAFLTWAFALVFLILAILKVVTRHGTPLVLRPFLIFGRVPFFFYVVHFYVLGFARGVLYKPLGLHGTLPETFAVWLALLLVMAAPCAWYYRKKRDRPNVITRYF